MAACIVTLTLPACGSKKDAQPDPRDAMEGGSGATGGSADDGGPGRGPASSSPVTGGDGEAGSPSSVVRGEGFPSWAEDDPSTPRDERVDSLPINDERHIEDLHKQIKDVVASNNETVTPDALPEAMGGVTPDSEFIGGNADDPSRAPVIEHTDKGRKVRVWYGTNRAFRDPADPSKGFANARESDPSVLHVGSVICDVPNSRPVGTTGSGWLARTIKGEDDRIKIEKLWIEEEELFFRQIARRLELAPDSQRSIVIYIHGYKNSFESAALRAAQLAVDLNVPGLTAFYSWPSMDAISEYNADEAAVETAEKHLKHFLVRMAKDTNASKVHLIAHSMGNRVLARVMQRIVSEPETKDLKFGQIILAAPDIDSQVFFDLAQAYPKLSERTTLYVSQKDKALEASAWTHSYPRAGYAPPVVVMPPIDTIEVTNIDVSILGHGYVAEAEQVLFDIAMLLRSDTPPQQRPRLKPADYQGKPFWVLQEGR
jgi:esterase/lipase superfamily enzyme